MKIAFLDDEPEIYPQQYGGKARTILNLAHQFVHHPEVEDVLIMSRSINADQDEFEIDGIHFKKLSDYSILRDIVDVASSVDVLNVHSCSFTMPYLSGLPSATVYHLHDVLFATADAGSHLDKALGNSWSAIVSPSLFAQRVLANIAWWRDMRSEIKVIRRGVDFTTFHETDKKDALDVAETISPDLASALQEAYPVIFFPHRFNAGKGEDLLEEILTELSTSFAHPLLVTTDNHYGKQSEKRYSCGWLSSHQMKFLYTLSDLTLILSRQPESFSQVALESLACRTPVIASRSGNLAELIDTIPAVYPTEPVAPEVAVAVMSLLSNEERSHEDMRHTEELLRSRFDIIQVAQEFIDHYRTIPRNCALREPRIISQCNTMERRFFLSPYAMLYEHAVYVPTTKGTLRRYDLSEDEHALLSILQEARTAQELGQKMRFGQSQVHRAVDHWLSQRVIVRV